MNRNDSVEISCEIRHVTDMGVLVFDGAKEAWLPKKLISDPPDEDIVKGRMLSLTIPEWLAVDKGLL